jgi:hypothetical protein
MTMIAGMVLATAIQLAAPTSTLPTQPTPADLRAGYCTYILGERRKLLVEAAGMAAPDPIRLTSLDDRRARLDAYLASRAAEIDVEQVRTAGRQRAVTQLFELLAKASGKCSRSGDKVDMACVNDFRRRSSIPREQAFCDDLSWLHDGGRPRAKGALTPDPALR